MPAVKDATSQPEPEPSGAGAATRTVIAAADLLMLRLVMVSLRRHRRDYCQAIGEHNVATLVLSLFHIGFRRESELRDLLGVCEAAVPQMPHAAQATPPAAVGDRALPAARSTTGHGGGTKGSLAPP